MRLINVFAHFGLTLFSERFLNEMYFRKIVEKQQLILAIKSEHRREYLKVKQQKAINFLVDMVCCENIFKIDSTKYTMKVNLVFSFRLNAFD